MIVSTSLTENLRYDYGNYCLHFKLIEITKPNKWKLIY